MQPIGWPCPLPGGGSASEYALTFDRGRACRLLIVPALFDEGNRLRRLTVEVMRRMDATGIDCFLPDLPGCNESMQLLELQDTADWIDAMLSAARCFGATHVLGIRGGCLFTPSGLATFHYAPVEGDTVLRQMLRARVLASREAGREERRDALADLARGEGIDLGGYSISAGLFAQLETLKPNQHARVISQDDIGGSGLWLRAEPGDSRKQADALAASLAMVLIA